MEQYSHPQYPFEGTGRANTTQLPLVDSSNKSHDIVKGRYPHQVMVKVHGCSFSNHIIVGSIAQSSSSMFNTVMWTLPLLLILAHSLPNLKCDLQLFVSQVRKPIHSQILIDHQEKTICVTIPKTQQYKLISVSFLPTSCIAYQQDQFPEDYSLSQDLIYFIIKVKRDKCIPSQPTLQKFSLLLKQGIEITNRIGFDGAVIAYFAVAILLSLVIYFPLATQIQKGSLFRSRKYEPL